MRLRKLSAMVLLSLLPAAALAAGPQATASGRISLAQLLDGLHRAPQDAAARTLVRSYFDAAVGAAVAASAAAPEPIICNDGNAQGRFDAGDFAAFAVKAAPTRRAQAARAAAPLVLAYLMEKYPCTE